MTSGKYVRCDVYGCKKKAQRKGLCPQHARIRINAIFDSNPALMDAIDEIVSVKLAGRIETLITNAVEHALIDRGI